MPVITLIDDPRASIFDSGCRALVNPVNCYGTMGGGLAAEFKQRFPQHFNYYYQVTALASPGRGLNPGGIYVDYQSTDDVVLVALATKDHWRPPSKLEWVQAGVDALVTWLLTNPSITSVAVPALGCGKGQLDWKDVLPEMLARFERLPPHVEVKIYGPR